MTDNIVPSKPCKKCGIVFPATLEFFNKSKTCKYGVKSWCRSCEHAWHKEHQKKPEVQARLKTVSKNWYASHRQKRHEQYLANKDNPDWLEHKKLIAHIYNTSESSHEKQRTRAKTPERREYQKIYRRAWSKTEKGIALSKRSQATDKRRQWLYKWRRTEKGILHGRQSAHRRKALKKAAGGSYSQRDIEVLLKTSKRRCWWCGKKIKGQYHIDHRIPLARGGSNDASNLCISCPKCNLSKHDKLPSEWSDRLL